MALPSLARVPAPPDPILGLAEIYRSDPRPEKINLTSGVFVDESGTTPILATVVEAERRLAQAAATKLYRPIDGEVAYRDAVRALALGADHEAVTSGRALATQTPGGTGGLRVAADLLRQTGSGATLWMSEPTWPNHPQLFAAAGFKVRSYPYTDAGGRRIDEAAMLAALGDASPGDVVLLHGACHNPTGVDPSADLWRRIGDVVEERRLLPLVDLAYQGFGDGLAEDAAGLRELLRPDAELLVSTSFSKTFSLYAERVGALIVVARSKADADAAQTNVKAAIRTNYSNPPAHGADVVRTILTDPDLRARWELELAAMRDRINANRGDLVEALQRAADPGRLGRHRRPAGHVRPARAVEGTGRPAPGRARGLRRRRGPDQRRGLHVVEPVAVRRRAGEGGHGLNDPSEREAVEAAIRVAFAGVTLGNGVSLKHTEAIDHYYEGSYSLAWVHRMAQLETTEDWALIPESELRCEYLAFLDPEGLRYYLPALLLWLLDHYNDLRARDDVKVDMTVIGTMAKIAPYSDSGGRRFDQFDSFTDEQRTAVAMYVEALPAVRRPRSGGCGASRTEPRPVLVRLPSSDRKPAPAVRRTKAGRRSR